MSRHFSLLTLSLLLVSCATGPSSEVAYAQKIYDSFAELCYEQANEVVRSKPERPTTLYISRSSSIIGQYSFELFFGTSRPRRWAHLTLVDAPAPAGVQHQPGAYELRYTYVPIEKVIDGRSHTFRGVRQEVIDLKTSEVIAERQNFVWGTDFNRSEICLDADWFDGSNDFADRMFGYRYRDESKHSPTPKYYTKAKLLTTERIDTTLPNYSPQDTLPAGAQEDYNHRRYVLSDGTTLFMPDFRLGQPMQLVGTIEGANEFIFIHLPDGGGRNRSLRQLLLFYRAKDGTPLKKVFVQIPKAVDWSNGWGMAPTDVYVHGDKITIRTLGAKHRTGKYSDQPNAGRYRLRYTFEASLQ